jgi:hypothetical protein
VAEVDHYLLGVRAAVEDHPLVRQYLLDSLVPGVVGPEVVVVVVVGSRVVVVVGAADYRLALNRNYLHCRSVQHLLLLLLLPESPCLSPFP